MILKLKTKRFTAIKIIFLEDVDIGKVLLSKKISSGEKNYKYFIGYLHDDDYKLKPLHIMHLRSSAYVESYDVQTRWIYVLIENDDLLENYNTIWDKVTADIKKEFDSKPAYNKKI